MAITKLFERYNFPSIPKLDTVLQDYRRKTNELITYFLGTDFGNLRLYDTDQSNLLDIKWNEDDSNPYTLNLKVNSGNRTINLAGNLTVESASIINSDLSTDANWATSGTLGCGKLTVDAGVAQAIIIKGTSTGNANLGWLGFYDSDGTTRRGHIGDGSVGNDDIYIGADTGYLRLLAAGYISLGTHTYFPDDVVMSFGASLDYSIGYYSTDDEFQIVDGSTLDSNVRLKLDSSGHFDFGAGNLTTTGTLGCGVLTAATGSTVGNLTLADGSITDSGGAIDFGDENLSTDGYIKIGASNELRFYDNGNYVGFEAPALGADQIWVLPSADGLANDVLGTDSGGNLIWITGTSLGNVIAAANFGTDNVILRSDGTGKGVQHTGVVIDDSNNVTFGAQVLIPNNKVTIGSAVPTPSAYLDVRANNDAMYVATFEQDHATGWGVLIDTDSVTAGDPVLRINNSSGTIFNVDSTGNIGMGTASPGDYNAVADNLVIYEAAGAGITLATGTSGIGYIFFADGTSGTAEYEGAIGYNHTDNSMLFQTDHVSRMTIDSTGNLTLSSATSTITGGTALAIEAGATGIVSQTIYDDTTVSAGNVRCSSGAVNYKFERSTSGEKYKDKIKDLELDSSLIYNLRPVSFNSKCENDDKDKRFIGLIADEIELIYPEIIDYNKNNKAEGYDNQMLMTLMLSQLQKMNQRIEALEAKK